jgi:hypothetical protein
LISVFQDIVENTLSGMRSIVMLSTPNNHFNHQGHQISPFLRQLVNKATPVFWVAGFVQNVSIGQRLEPII